MDQSRLKLNEIFDDWQTGAGIFSALQNYTVPWAGNDIATLLDLEYHGNISGDKYVSPLLQKLVQNSTISDAERDRIAHIIVSICGVNWNRQYETMELVYNPIENYSMAEQMIDDQTINEYGKTRTRTDNLSHSKTGTETDAPNVTETQTPDLTNKTANSVYGFNSSSAVPSGDQTEKSTGTYTNKRTGTETREYNTTDRDTGTQMDNDGGKDTQTRNYKLTRSGNIGVTTSQQMIESERDLWLWNFFRNVVFPDLDKILTLQIY